jgi:hypothetical protein
MADRDKKREKERSDGNPKRNGQDSFPFEVLKPYLKLFIFFFICLQVSPHQVLISMEENSLCSDVRVFVQVFLRSFEKFIIVQILVKKNMYIFIYFRSGLVVSSQQYVFNTEKDRDVVDSNNYVNVIRSKKDLFSRSDSPSDSSVLLRYNNNDIYYEIRSISKFSASLHPQPVVSIADSLFIMQNCRPFSPFMSSPFRWPTVNTLTVRSAYSRLFALDCLVGTLSVLLRKVFNILCCLLKCR